MNFTRNRYLISETTIYSNQNKKLVSYKGWPPQIDIGLLDTLLKQLDISVE